MNARVSANDNVVPDMHMSSHTDIIGKDIIIPNHTVMCNMSIDHEQVMATVLGQALVLNRATVQTAVLTNLVVLADLKPGFFAGIVQTLAHLAYTGELENFSIFTYTRIATHHLV